MRALGLALLMLLFLGMPMSARAQDMPLSQVLIPGEDWQLVGAGYKFTEGPAADAQGNVYFTDVPTSTIYRIEQDGTVGVFDDQAEKTSGLCFGPGGKLYACRMGGRKIVVYPRPMRSGPPECEVLAEDVDVNDLAVDYLGGVYFTDPKHSRVMYVDPGKRLHTVAEEVNPNGVVLSPRGGMLVVTEAKQPWLWAFRVEHGGQLSSRAPYFGVVQIRAGEELPRSDGMAFDDDGRLYLASAVGLQVFDPTGRYSGVIHKPQPAFLSNVIFGGSDFKTLYVTCQDKVFCRKVQPAGRPAWQR